MLLDVNDYPKALARKRAIDGKGLSKQAFFLLPKIAEIDAALTPERQRSVVESHPGACVPSSAGHAAPLEAHRRPDARSASTWSTGSIGPQPLPAVRGADIRDVLDAVVLTATAVRLTNGTAERLGDGTRDERGLVMEIAW